MSAIRASQLIVQGEPVRTLIKSVFEKDVPLLVEVGSSGLDGDDDHESLGRTYVGLLCDSPVTFFDPLRDKRGKIVGVEISGCGDSALSVLAEALEFAARVLKDIRNESTFD